MRIVLPVALMLVPMLGGCDRGVTLTNASIEEVVAATKDADRQQPGKWEITTELEKMQLGGAGAGADKRMADVLQQQVGQQRVDTTCLTPEQAKAPALAGIDQLKGGNCRFATLTLKGGKLDATMRCVRPGGVMTVTQSGRYSATDYDLRSTVAQEGGPAPMSMTMHVVARRTGECAK